MKVYTENPILVDPLMYSSLDGGSSSEDVKAFQRWVYYVKKDASISTKKQKDGVDGIFGKKTSAAWNKYGDEYTKLVESATPKPSENKEQPKPSEQVIEKPEEKPEKIGWWKRQTTLTKSLIIGGGVVILLIVALGGKGANKKTSKKSKK